LPEPGEVLVVSAGQAFRSSSRRSEDGDLPGFETHWVLFAIDSGRPILFDLGAESGRPGDETVREVARLRAEVEIDGQGFAGRGFPDHFQDSRGTEIVE